MKDGNSPGSGRSDLVWALAIGVLGLALRVACAREFAADPLGRSLWIDEQAYWQKARAIVAGRVVPDRPFYQDPLYPYLLAGLMVVVGDGVAPLRVTLAAIGALTPLAVFWAGRVGLGRAEARVAGAAAAVYGPLVFTDVGLEKEAIGALLAATALGLTAVAAGRRRGVGAAGASGAAWGALALLRSNALVVGPVGAAWWIGAFPKGEVRVRRAFAFAGAFAACLAPAVAVNLAVSNPREFLGTTWQAGPNFYLGNGPEATGTMTDLPFVVANPAYEADDYRREAERRLGRTLSPGEVSRFWLVQGVRRWRDDPAASLRLLAKKVFLLANAHEIADNHDGQYVRLSGAAPALGWAFLHFGWVAPFAALGLARPRGGTGAGRTPFWWFLVLSTAAGLGATALFFVVGRYRIPWTPGLILLGASGAVDLARRAASRRWRGVAWRVALLALPAASAAWAPTPLPADDRWGLALRRQFKASLLAGELGPAVDALDDARALGPRPMARIAAMLERGPEHDRLAAFEVDGETRIVLVRRLRQVPEGRAESRRILEAALAADPSDTVARRELGAWWLGAVNDPAARSRAVGELRLAATGRSGDASAAVLLALMTSDPRALDLPALRRARDSARVRVARAIVSEGSR